MSDSADPLLPFVRQHFDAVLSGDESALEAVAWSHDQIERDTWRDEIAFQGLMRLADLVAVDWAYASESGDGYHDLFRSYWDWMELVRWYEDDPTAWNVNYYRRQIASFEDAFGTERARKAALSLVRAGELTEDEVAGWFS